MKDPGRVALSILILALFLLSVPAAGARGGEPLPGKAWLGVTVEDAPHGRGQGATESAGGVVVADVIKGGPAEQAGLNPGDRVVGVNGQEVYGVSDFVTLIQSMSAGTPAIIEVDRDGQIKTVDVVLTGRPAGLFAHGGYYTGAVRKGCDGAGAYDTYGVFTGGRPGMKDGGKYGKMYFMGMLHTLGLTPEQEKKAGALERGYLKKSIKAEADIMVAEVELDELASAQKVDLKKVKAKIDEIAGKKAALRFFRFQSLEAFKKILTPGQMKKMDKMRLMSGDRTMAPAGHGGYEVYGKKRCSGHKH